MKGLDTNVLIRHLIKDDRDQARTATKFIRSNCTRESPCWINRIVLCELEWVLTRAYRYPRPVIAEIFDKILRTSQFLIEDGDEASGALRAYRGGGADFADCIQGIINAAQGCEVTATFDRKASPLDGFELLIAEPGEGS